MITSFRLSATLPATPVHSRGIRAVKSPLFDNTRMAALLSSATRVPMDAQHLPIKTIKFIKNDTALQIEVQVPKDAEIPGLKKPAATTTSQAADDDGGVSPQQRRGGGASRDDQDGDGDKKPVGFEYELASGRLTLMPDFEAAKKPVWASVSPDEKTIVFARGHNLFMMDGANYTKARRSPGDASVVETAITTDGCANSTLPVRCKIATRITGHRCRTPAASFRNCCPAISSYAS